MNEWKKYILVVVLLLIPHAVWAGNSTAKEAEKNKAQAIENFKKGVTSFDSKNFEDALFFFQNAYDLNPSWKLFYNIAHCEAALKHYGLAVVTFERYLAEGGDGVPEARRDEVLTELERMRKMIGDLDIVAPHGIDVFVDGIHRGVTPLPGAVSVSAGLLHLVEFKEDGNVVFSAQKTVRGGAISHVVYEGYVADDQTVSPDVLPPTPIPTETAVTSSPAESHRNISPVPFWIATGATILAGGATIGLAAYVGVKKDDVASDDEASSVNRIRKIGIGTLVGTGVSGVTALVLAIFTDFSGEQKTSPVSFYGSPTEGGLVLSGSF